MRNYEGSNKDYSLYEEEFGMNVGVSTISWGIQIANISEVLDVIKLAGFQGVEIPQRPDSLGVANIEELKILLDERDLELLTFNGGTLKERVDFCGDIYPQYLYVEHWDLKNVNYALERGFTVAFHPRVFAPNGQLSDVIALIRHYPDLKIILDVAHCMIAGNDPVDALNKLSEKLVAVHLKDWKPDYGRSNYRFARGFTLLGQGEVNLPPIIQYLQDNRFGGWVVAELDHAKISPQKSVQANAEWLASKNLLKKPVVAKETSASPPIDATVQSTLSTDIIREAQFREELMNAMTGDAETFYDAVAKAFSHLIDCKFIRVSTYHSSDGEEFVTPRAGYPSHLLSRPQRSNLRHALTGIAIERQAPFTEFDLTKAYPGQKYGYLKRTFYDPKMRESQSLTKMISVPIYNSGNQNTVRIVVNLFPKNQEKDYSKENWYELGKAVTQAVDSMLDGLCTSASTKVNLLAGKSHTAKDFLVRLVDLIKETINCEGVAIFLVNESGDRLELPAELTTNTKWMVPYEQRYYKKDQGITGSVWSRNQVIISDPRQSRKSHQGRSTEIVANQDININLWVPLLGAKGEVIGVIRCRNKNSTPNTIAPGMFSNDDAAILDAIVQAAAPHIHILQGDEIRAKSMSKLMHELRTPLVAIRGAADFLIRDRNLTRIWQYDYLGDIWSWGDLMQRLMVNANWFSYSSQGLQIRAERTFLMADIIAPSVKQVSLLLEERGFSASRIHYGKFDQIPPLYIDRNQFQQVMFNLLSNAIKHCYDDPNSFEVEIQGEMKKGEYVVCFRDWGPGIAVETSERIFEEGFRTSEAIRRNITGQGLGLWVAHHIIRAHDGRITVTNHRHPLEISIFLPGYLKSRAPQTK